VLLVDADLRKAGVHLEFDLTNNAGLADVLLGKSEAENVMVPCGPLPNLTILPAGAPPPTPAEMLGSTHMRELMMVWRAEYDYIIIDTPPILAVTDALRLSDQADSVLVVLRADQTPREALARTCDVLNQAHIPVLGIVVNDVKFGSGASYYYGYSPELAKIYYPDDARSS